MQSVPITLSAHVFDHTAIHSGFLFLGALAAGFFAWARSPTLLASEGDALRVECFEPCAKLRPHALQVGLYCRAQLGLNFADSRFIIAVLRREQSRLFADANQHSPRTGHGRVDKFPLQHHAVATPENGHNDHWKFAAL